MTLLKRLCQIQTGFGLKISIVVPTDTLGLRLEPLPPKLKPCHVESNNHERPSLLKQVHLVLLPKFRVPSPMIRGLKFNLGFSARDSGLMLAFLRLCGQSHNNRVSLGMLGPKTQQFYVFTSHHISFSVVRTPKHEINNLELIS